MLEAVGGTASSKDALYALFPMTGSEHNRFFSDGDALRDAIVWLATVSKAAATKLFPNCPWWTNRHSYVAKLPARRILAFDVDYAVPAEMELAEARQLIVRGIPALVAAVEEFSGLTKLEATVWESTRSGKVSLHLIFPVIELDVWVAKSMANRVKETIRDEHALLASAIDTQIYRQGRKVPYASSLRIPGSSKGAADVGIKRYKGRATRDACACPVEPLPLTREDVLDGCEAAASDRRTAHGHPVVTLASLVGGALQLAPAATRTRATRTPVPGGPVPRTGRHVGALSPLTAAAFAAYQVEMKSPGCDPFVTEEPHYGVNTTVRARESRCVYGVPHTDSKGWMGLDALGNIVAAGCNDEVCRADAPPSSYAYVPRAQRTPVGLACPGVLAGYCDPGNDFMGLHSHSEHPGLHAAVAKPPVFDAKDCVVTISGDATALQHLLETDPGMLIVAPDEDARGSTVSLRDVPVVRDARTAASFSAQRAIVLMSSPGAAETIAAFASAPAPFEGVCVLLPRTPTDDIAVEEAVRHAIDVAWILGVQRVRVLASGLCRVRALDQKYQDASARRLARTVMGSGETVDDRGLDLVASCMIRRASGVAPDVVRGEFRSAMTRSFEMLTTRQMMRVGKWLSDTADRVPVLPTDHYYRLVPTHKCAAAAALSRGYGTVTLHRITTPGGPHKRPATSALTPPGPPPLRAPAAADDGSAAE